MDDVLKTRFGVFWPTAWLDRRNEVDRPIRQIAKDMGIERTDQLDAFRHGYGFARISRDTTEDIARAAGQLNEVVGANARPERQGDLINNEVAFKIKKEADAFVEKERTNNPSMSEQEADDLWERYARIRAAEAARSGELVPNPKGHSEEWGDIDKRYETDVLPRERMEKVDRPSTGPFQPLYGMFKKW